MLARMLGSKDLSAFCLPPILKSARKAWLQGPCSKVTAPRLMWTASNRRLRMDLITVPVARARSAEFSLKKAYFSPPPSARQTKASVDGLLTRTTMSMLTPSLERWPYSSSPKRSEERAPRKVTGKPSRCAAMQQLKGEPPGTPLYALPPSAAVVGRKSMRASPETQRPEASMSSTCGLCSLGSLGFCSPSSASASSSSSSFAFPLAFAWYFAFAFAFPLAFALAFPAPFFFTGVHSVSQ
mmetsp:Transcript_56306/g.164574  ORF Transcript_56306/g.164574 Transcript_56306/m.164574 type:complete len:240 (-) Transcript_56306:192-911(-)